ncbi:hypothetical protein [Streptomyces lateritius]|uniref:hypothetical protein n=1 Tax=Streptomyces lateritius TaxID=67313 RepID=UPI001673CA58|nr:hypothetical protein [Streptomyces lateritius]
MHLRKAAPSLILAALLSMSGCVSVHHQPASPPAHGRPAGLAPAADRPPSPLPTWPEPRQAPPREVLESTDPGTEPKKKTPATAQPRRKRAQPARTRTSVPRRTERYGAPPKIGTPRTGRPAPKPRPPQMARLCGQADGVVAPGIVKLCRDAYGR